VSDRARLWIVPAAVVAVVAISAGVAALTHDSTSNHAGRAQAPVPPNLPQCGLTSSPGPDATSQIVAVLRRYSCAFSNHDVAAMQAMFTPDIVRRALRNGGCDTTHGRTDVVAVYRDEEFPTTNGEYALRPINLDPRVRLNRDRTAATVTATFLITQGGAGPISFGLRKTGEGWQIARVITRC
jgi:SnoaL-like domain